jgi:uncharacterized membrane protein
MIDPSLLGLVVILGLVTGMRSMLALALLTSLAPPVAWLSNMWAWGLTSAAAVGELVLDKLPKTPGRLSPGPFFGRLGIGGLVGGLLMVRPHAPIWIGAGLGALSAAAGAVAGNKLRAALGRKTGIRDRWFALAEDMIALGAGVWALLGPLAPSAKLP